MKPTLLLVSAALGLEAVHGGDPHVELRDPQPQVKAPQVRAVTGSVIEAHASDSIALSDEAFAEVVHPDQACEVVTPGG